MIIYDNNDNAFFFFCVISIVVFCSILIQRRPSLYLRTKMITRLVIVKLVTGEFPLRSVQERTDVTKLPKASRVAEMSQIFL